MKSSDASKARGFTLVELLVVVGIIAILISILLPVINKARHRAMTIQCAANLRTLGQALTMYTQQYQYYPGAWVAVGSGSGIGPYVIWAPRLRATLKGNQGAFNCLAADSRSQWGQGVTNLPAYATPLLTQYGYQEGELLLPQGHTWFSYGYNAFGTFTVGGFIVAHDPATRGLGGGDHLSTGGGKRFSPIKASRVKVQSEMVAIADSNGRGTSDFEILCPVVLPHQGPGRRHNGGANVLFCDGHVQWYLPEDIAPENATVPDRIRRMWNNDHEP